MEQTKYKGKKKSNNELFAQYLGIYLVSGFDGRNTDELEIRFGTKFWNPITQIDFNNVIAKLKSAGFVCNDPNGEYHLNINNQYTDPRTGQLKISNIRTEVQSIFGIQEYCKKNTFDKDKTPSYIHFMQKLPKRHQASYEEGNVRLSPIDFNNFQFRVNYKEEKDPDYKLLGGMLSRWENSRKIFRFIKRFTFTHKDYPLKVDCSIVQTSHKSARHRMIPEYRIETAKVFENPQSYEIEIELLRSKLDTVQFSFYYQQQAKLLKLIKKNIMIVLSGLQGSNFPIAYTEQEEVLRNYMKILYNKESVPDRRIRSRDFVGPSSISLELINVSPLDPDARIPNIRMPYTTTDKADGARKLMFINKSGKVYLIDVNMRVQFTGVFCEHHKYFNTIIDGEHVLHDKMGTFINTYLAFDIYYLKGEDIRSHPFIDIAGVDNAPDSKFRLIILNEVMKNLDLVSILSRMGQYKEREKLPMQFETKTFYKSNGDEVFTNCDTILRKEEEGLFPYEIDGLIFTPADKGVGSNTVGETMGPTKKTWDRSFKWKPPAFNTIDFLVTTKKTAMGEDFIGNLFQDGEDMGQLTQLTQYKTLILRVGYDERKHGYMNPCSDVINDRLPSRKDRDHNDTYKPVPFHPTDPSPSFPAYLCNIALADTGGVKYMFTEDKKNVIEDGTIVEFRYEIGEEKFWQWKPIRTRPKKTAEYRKGGRNYGNAYHVAQSVWKSIHNPVTKAMITTGANIPDELVDDDIYYNRKGSTITRALRDFHNLFVKRSLILGASTRGGTLIDMTAGKAGDFPKWIGAKLSFVFGLDVARDNIENRLDGACARFLNYKKKFYTIPYALFVAANSHLNIRSGEACFTEQGKEIVKAVFGQISEEEATKIGAGVMRQYGKGSSGFDVVSNQFSIHYFFENLPVLAGFLRNVSECCKIGGYFIGTSYDGRKVFRLLEQKSPGESVHIIKDEKKMWEIKKQYDHKQFPNTKASVGYKIDVYQESINKVFSEYLVNYEYLTTLMENFGFVLLSSGEAQTMGLPNSLGNFNELFNMMKEQIQRRQLKKSDVGTALSMSADEKRISFLNKYFVFKKVRDVNAEQVARILADETTTEEIQSVKDSIELQKAVDEAQQTKPKVKKLKKKLKIKAKLKESAETGSTTIVVTKPKTIKLKPKGKIKIVRK